MNQTGKRIVAIGKGNTITVDNGWAQLDEANKSDGHYQREPLQLIDARNALQELEQEEIRLIDRMTNEAIAAGYFTWHTCREYSRYIQLQRELNDARAKYDRLYAEYNSKKSEGTFIHTNTITEKVPEWEKSLEKA